ncbi:hypothetical protein ES702_01890 [subsurface metagenome]
MPKKINSGLEIYSLEELAKKLGLHIVTLRRYCRTGRIKAQKIGRNWQVSGDNLKAFINAEKI